MECVILVRKISHYQLFLGCAVWQGKIPKKCMNIPNFLMYVSYGWWSTIVIAILSATSLEVHGRNVIIVLIFITCIPAWCTKTIIMWSFCSRFTSSTAREQGNLADMHSLNMNMNETCTVSTTYAALIQLISVQTVLM